MRVYSLASGLLALALWGVLGEKPAPTHPSLTVVEAAVADLNVSKPLELNSGCIGCEMCGGGPTGPHLLIHAGQLMVYPGEPHFHECLPTFCMEWHYLNYECGGEALSREEQGALWLAATGQDADAMRAALDRFPQAIKLNLEHSSLQLYNCLGEITASIPLHSDHIVEIQGALGQ